MTTPIARLRALIALAGKATPAPWTLRREYYNRYWKVQLSPELAVCRTFGNSIADDADAAFIAASRNAIPDMEAVCEENERLKAEQSECLSAKANAREYAAMLVRLRDRLINIKDDVSDEGDRVYFGSSNDADMFRDQVQGLDDLAWDRVMRDSVDGPDIYKAAQISHARADTAESALAALHDELERTRKLSADNVVAHLNDEVAARGALAALRGQVEAEREICARIADRFTVGIEQFENSALYPRMLGQNETAWDIANAIRARAALATPEEKT